MTVGAGKGFTVPLPGYPTDDRTVNRISRAFRFFALSAAALLACTRAIGYADEVEKLLRRPISPGSIALLANYAGKPGVAERLRAGLKSADPGSRGAAARVINVAITADLVPALQEALAAESDPIAAREQIQALAAIGGSPFDAAILEATRRFSPRLDSDVMVILGRTRGVAAFPLYFETLRTLSITDYARVSFFKVATRGQPNALIAAAALALGRHDSISWQAVLAAADELGTPIDSPLLETALRSNQLVFRGEAAWYLAKTYCGRPPASSVELLQAIAEGEPAAATEIEPELRFGSEILRRVLGKAPVEDEAWIACLESNTKCHLDSDLGESPLLEFLTPREREAVIRRNEANCPPELKAGEKGKPATVHERETLLRLVRGLPNGVAESLFEVEGCTSGPRMKWFSVAVVDFRKDGIPRHVAIRTQPSGGSCRRTTETLFLMSIAPATVPDPSSEPMPYLALFVPSALSCQEGPPSGAPGAANPDVVRVRGKVQAPKLMQKVEPLYPKDSRRNGEQGVSVYEGIITTTGCVTDLRLLKSSSPVLDIMGMEAVAQWRYQPAMLDGRPVRVFLTVTVTFRLN